MISICDVIVRSEVDEYVIIVDWYFSDKRGRMADGRLGKG
jgi:hypothetical protein